MVKEMIADNELEMVSGGAKATANTAAGKEQLMRIACPKCGEVFQADVQKKSVKCPNCSKIIVING